MFRKSVAPILAVVLGVSLTAAPAWTAKPPSTWDNLVRTPSKKIDFVYLLPGADFRGYSKVMLEQTEVAFRKNFKRDYNDSTLDLARKLNDDDIQKISTEVRDGFEKLFIDAYTKAGYQVVQAPAEDVLRVRTAVTDLYVTAPDKMSPGRVYTFSDEAGEATLVIEARDSVTGALLGRAVDKRTIGDMGPYIRNSVSNRGDFEQVFKSWAKTSVDGLGELKARSPLPEQAPAASR